MSPEYRDYIDSPRWARRRRRALALSGRRCQYEIGHDAPDGLVSRCTRARYLCVHHLCYDRLGSEADADLEVLCWFHHMVEHLAWFACAACGQPLLGHAEAAAWLDNELRGAGIDLDRGRIDWRSLPTKEALRARLPSPDRCREHAHDPE